MSENYYYIVYYSVSGQKFITENQVKLEINDKILCETPYGWDVCDIIKIIDYKNTIDKKIISSALCVENIIKENISDNLNTQEYLEFLKEQIDFLHLDMKIIKARVMYSMQLGATKTFLVFFCSKERVDFRKLVKDFNKKFNGIYIKLHQLFQREISLCTGGVGSCGRIMCCCLYKPLFNNCLSRKVAKKENIKIDELKNIGHCENIKCCMSYESETLNE